MKFFDAHTHVHFAAFQNDYKEVVACALEKDVWLINVGTQQDTSRRAVEVAHEYPEGVYATIGLHPIHTEQSYHDEKELGGGDEAKAFIPTPQRGSVFSRLDTDPRSVRGFTSRGEKFDPAYYLELGKDPKVVAIGECGLDYYRLGEETKKRQAEAFLDQMEVAHTLRKPLMIHCRGSISSPQGNAFADLIELLFANRHMLSAAPGVVHFFSGTKENAKSLMDLGFSFTFGGVLTFPPKAPVLSILRSRSFTSMEDGRSSTATEDGGQPSVDTLHEVVRYIPMDRILSETDAPYVAPVPYRGKRNEPAYVIEVVEKIAEIKGKDFERVTQQIRENAKKIFGV